MKALPYLVFAILTMITVCGCNTTENSNDNNHPEFRWEIDTIEYQDSLQTLMNILWGSSPNNLWAAGHNERGFGKVFHYDGKKWIDIIPISASDYTYSLNTAYSISDEVLIGGSASFLINNPQPHFSDSSLILKFKANLWKVVKLGQGGAIESISGNNQGKVYAAGQKLTLFSYENSNWLSKNTNGIIPENYETKNINSVLIDQNNNAHMLIYCYNSNPYFSYNYYIIEDHIGFTKIDSFETDHQKAEFGMDFWQSPAKTIFSFNPGVYKLTGYTWTSLYNNSDIITAISGTSDDNIFAAGHSVYHFNGAEWMEYKEFSNRFGLARDVLVVGKDIFILFSDSRKSFILKGFNK